MTLQDVTSSVSFLHHYARACVLRKCCCYIVFCNCM